MEKQAALDLLEFIHESPTNFHAVLSIKQRLQAHGFKQLFSGEAWHIEHGGKYFVTKNHSSLYAFIPGNGNLAEEGFKLICAHSDSPTFRIKPHAEMPVEGKYLKLNTEVYGGPIMYTWFGLCLWPDGSWSRVTNPLNRPLNSSISTGRCLKYPISPSISTGQ